MAELGLVRSEGTTNRLRLQASGDRLGAWRVDGLGSEPSFQPCSPGELDRCGRTIFARIRVRVPSGSAASTVGAA